MTITLYKTPQGWMARYSGNGSTDIEALFGTNVLPTPFTAQAKPQVVMAEIERLNPEADVWLDRSEQGSTLLPVLAVLTALTVAAVLIAQSGLLSAVLARLAEVR